MAVFLVIAWGFAGILTLSSKEVSKFEYAMVWGLLMVNLILNAVGV